ncbi:P1 family peptidase [Phycicoccus endophyticus]|uniref:P1 family peptidase n=1 Tax=Phycicoccus endophyticus TaxID=1690220 RepID=A0A7G9R2M0_9MICO|nr:P1 family peptidase [Phycicoccus endophyticus]NHI20692.1 peptidase S58 family protein [Phycicoccus endophyticus]QNN49845.1 P1 family peptidase [Phycicoccus endophyticus]
MRAGTHNAITDVEGVRVGHATREEPGWLTGVTVVVPPLGTVGGVDVRGGGPGTRETDLLDPANGVDAVDAVVLAGGSAFGLAAADGVAVAAWEDGRGWPVGAGPEERVPIVPAAIVFDLGRGGSWRHHPGPADGAAAYRAASSGPVAMGALGAATGARAGGLRGGVGSASVVLDSGTTLGALVVVNAVGSPVAPDGSLLAAAWGLPGELDGLPPAAPGRVEAYLAGRRAEAEALRAGTATTLAVVATDATLTKAGCRRLATVSHDGMARALSPVHTAFDGDTVFSLATGAGPVPEGLDLVDLHDAAARCVTRAVGRALAAATSVDRSADGGLVAPSWRAALTAG